MDNKFDRHRGGGGGGGDRYNATTTEEPRHYSSSARHSRGGGSPFPHHRQRNSRGGGGGSSPHDYRTSAFSSGGGRASASASVGRESYRPFNSPPRYPQPPTGDRGGGGLRLMDDGIEGFRRPVSGGEGFGPMGVTGERGFPPVGGGGGGGGAVVGGFRQMDGDRGGGVDEFQHMGGSGGGGSSAGRGFGSVVERSNAGEGLRPMAGGAFQTMAGRVDDGGGLGPAGSGRHTGVFQPIGSGGIDRERYALDSLHMLPPPLTGQKRGYPFSGRERSPDRGGGSFAKLFVGSVPRTATDDDIRPLFEKHGHVLEVALIKDKRTGQQQGCCFVKYASSEEADRAIRELHNQFTLPGGVGPIQVRYADGERERLGATEYKLFVGSLNRQATEKEVEEIFSPFGRVEDVYIMRDEMKQSRGCGFVKYSQREMAQAAINALNGAYTMSGCNQPLIVRFADPKRPRAGEPRGPPLSGPGFGPQLSAPGIRPPPEHGDLLHGSIRSWPSQSPQNLGPPSHVGTLGFGNQFPAESGDMTAIATQGTTQGLPGHSDGSLTGAAVSSTPGSHMSSNQPLPKVPSIGSEISPVQRPLQSPQHFPSLMHMQGSHAQPGQMQPPQSSGQTVYAGAPSSQHLLGRNGQLPVPHAQVQHNAPSTPGQTPVMVNQQPAPVMANQQPAPVQQLQPLSQSPSQLAQMLSQQKQTLQATFQSSQQTLNQLQQQVQQLQPPNKNLTAQAAKHQSAWSGTPSQPGVSTHNAHAAGDLAATSSSLSNFPAATAAISNCNWTEHLSPDGYKYYYNSLTGESKWEKPEELTLYEQQQQKKPSNQQPQLQSHPPGQLAQQTPPMQVLYQGRQSQLHNQAKPLQQASQTLHPEQGYSQVPTMTGLVNDQSQHQQGGAQAVQEWMRRNKHSGI
ncbi:flowering time control protein FCA [Andrographis paniculata]|uniref:flowering time control protein FCA n=1 Tax=Andrographis paniculata TaxID=175694 RepID=UPI0021E78C87|nr:flowering time control protein FCA [Andrographis paniculata]